MQFATALARSPGVLAVPAGHLGYRMGCRTYRSVYICVLGGIPVDARSGGEGLDSRLRGNDERAGGNDERAGGSDVTTGGVTKVGEDGQ